MTKFFRQKMGSSYLSLSPKLKEAADFVLENPTEVATQSLRSVAQKGGMAPAALSRLARAVGYENYEALRDDMREELSYSVDSFSAGVARIQGQGHLGIASFSTGHLAACARNLEALATSCRAIDMDLVVEQLLKSRSVVVLGGLSSAGIAEYLVYMASLIADNWRLCGRAGESLGGSLCGLGGEDCLIVTTKSPFSKSSIEAARFAKRQGAFVIVITDSELCPIVDLASVKFILPTDTPHFFSSYVATVALLESLVGMLAEKKGAPAIERISKIEAVNHRFEYSQE
ncbi:MAG: MurR/RpiR family transcriptional regulator [Cellvibrionaceae bacterium]|nr:MurR/RpiR family transcriptional regulator [Cellvibrionaceae bacterium]